VWFAWICDHPWGPCVEKKSVAWIPGGYYFLSIMQKSLVNGGQQLVVATLGDYEDVGKPTGRYTLTYIPVTIKP
jgi:hypothetical protein